ncbi:MAG: hypothetical protein JWO69_751 [Thermoleophilia bacterium]|jgi:hypothetical protein|nr:hypothetical protein [Thermoleophilia bacterium]
MWPFRRRRFREVVARQLAIFATDHGALVEEARAALGSYHREPDAQSALESYGEHDELAEQVEDLLDAMYRNFSSTLEGSAAADYRREFARSARAAYGDLLPRLSFDPPEDQLPE